LLERLNSGRSAAGTNRELAPDALYKKNARKGRLFRETVWIFVVVATIIKWRAR